MIKVLHFYKTYYPNSYGGIEQFIFQLCEGGIQYGISSTVLSLSQHRHCEDRQFGKHSVFYSPISFKFASTPFSFSAIPLFRRLAIEADIIHFHFPYPFMDIVHFVSANTKPTLVTYHSDIVKQKIILRLYMPLMIYFLKSIDHIVVSSPNYITTSSILQCYLKKISIIPFGLNREYYPVQDKVHEDKWRRKIGDRFFLFVGTFRYYKGLYTLIEAACHVPYPIVLVGTGPMENKLKKMSAKFKLKNVYFLGSLPDLDKAALLSSCYGIVLPSCLRSEAFGIFLLEGAMYGKPLISCEIGTGTTYVNIHQKTGLVIPPKSPIALSNAMHQLWQNPLQAQYYGKQARKRFNTLFVSSKMIRSYNNIYRDLLIDHYKK